MTTPTRTARTDPGRYGLVAVGFHWVLALLIPGMIALGWYMMSIEREPGSAWYFNLHKAIGLLIAVLVLLRLFWRLTHPPAALPASVPAWQATAARWSHRLLYVAMIAMPSLGIAGTLFSKNGLAAFGWSSPRLFAPNHDTAELFYGAHSVTAWILVVLIALHVLAGLKHLLIDRDGVFQRMWHA